MQDILRRLDHSLHIKQLSIAGGLAGIVSVTSYLLIAFLDLPDPIVFFLAMMFPILGIAFLFSLKGYIADRNPSFINDFAFILGSLAFTICAIMLSAQISVQTGIKISRQSAGIADLKLIRESLRLIDLGIDVAWDFFIGSHLIALAFAANKVADLKWWGWTLGILGTGLIALNTLTFPNPPGSSGYVDLGPVIAITWLLLGAHVLRLGIKMKA